ncbi:MAG: thioredoxin-like domain-containing protein, partial [Abditibacteriales bacterium]|nr:thioredoxin-like domain-containing protein [Abditibacteriales bacterium]
IPQLRKLEHKYKRELVVIGVHSAKFTTERETENVRQAVLRHNIEHPVVNDKGFVIWNQYGVRAWPTLVFIDPRGKIIGMHAGEADFEDLDRVVARIVETFDKDKAIDRTPIAFKLEKHAMPPSLLSFPGKVLADEASGRLIISDTNNNRIVVVSLRDGSVQAVIGSGAEGFADGAFDQAKLNHPQGVALDGNILYIADTENHSIRKADLNKRTVETIAGTGRQSRDYGGFGGKAKETPLSSPWDLVLHQGTLYIAMAGFHQLWAMNLSTGYVRPYAGSGREALIDGPLMDAALAQPSGLTTDGKRLYFADSESSSVRAVDLDPNGRVQTLVGPGTNTLFDFGDIDGVADKARFQHPIGITYHDGVLYVADTYNHKIKRVDPTTRRATTFVGTGKAGYADGDTPLFFEPSGLSVAHGKLYVADTNNHLIRVVDLTTKRVTTLEVKGLARARPTAVSDAAR